MFDLLSALNTRAAIDLLQQMARRPDPSTRKGAYIVLAWRRAGSWRLDPRTEAVAIDDLSNPLFTVFEKRDVARLLGFSQDSRPVPALIATLDATHRDTRIAAAWALGRLRDNGAIPALQACAAIDTDTGVQMACYDALADLGSPDGESQLRDCLQSVLRLSPQGASSRFGVGPRSVPANRHAERQSLATSHSGGTLPCEACPLTRAMGNAL
ncbi:hypothetical protein SBA3_4040003 [Candidatus Sulfopaludibacter sp. SbA3]|nr:hypothetical protein SBA3_4040003 [Candidatus Sulfopaludibacter sp. SbA3]